MAEVKSVLVERVPEWLGVGVEQLALLAGENTVSGIIFTPHVDGRYGAVEIAKQVASTFQEIGVPLEIVMYSGKAPDGSDANWAHARAESIDKYKANQAPLLVGTRAFGMGIDKPNIRYTIHAGMPSSLEAFAQEAGRAGRNGQPALCTLVAVLPDSEIAAELLAGYIGAEERQRRVQRIGDAKGADVRRQGFFLTTSFPGGQPEIAAANETLEAISEGAAGGLPTPGAIVTIALPRDWLGTLDKAARRQINEKRTTRDRALYRLAMLGLVDDITVDGDEVTVRVADWSAASLDDSILEYLGRIEPGRAELQANDIGLAPVDVAARVQHHLRILIEATYRIVARARLQALTFMYETAAGSDDAEGIRARINAYLGGGPVAMALSEAVASSEVDVRRFVEVMATIPLREQDDLAANTARYLEAYPEHPILLLASALGEARLPQADRTRFARSLVEAVSQFGRYGVSEADAASGMHWLSGLLRTEHGGRRREWLLEILQAWEAPERQQELLAAVEAVLLEDAALGRVGHQAADYVRSRRMKRHARQVRELADRLAIVHRGPQGGGDG